MENFNDLPDRDPNEEYRRRMRKGFSAGYRISKHEPHMFPFILRRINKADDPYRIGMLDGKKKHERETILEKINRHKALKDKNRDRER